MIEAAGKDPASRKQAVIDKVEAVKKEITAELKEHEGIYPHNDGVLNQAEVCRRAGVRPAVLQGPAHKTTTLPALNEWLKTVPGRFKKKQEARAEVTRRANEWKKAYEDVLFNYSLSELELIDARSSLAEKDQKIKDLEEEVALLREQVGKIVPLRKPTQEGDSWRGHQ